MEFLPLRFLKPFERPGVELGFSLWTWDTFSGKDPKEKKIA